MPTGTGRPTTRGQKRALETWATPGLTTSQYQAARSVLKDRDTAAYRRANAAQNIYAGGPGLASRRVRGPGNKAGVFTETPWYKR